MERPEWKRLFLFEVWNFPRKVQLYMTSSKEKVVILQSTQTSGDKINGISLLCSGKDTGYSSGDIFVE